MTFVFRKRACVPAGTGRSLAPSRGSIGCLPRSRRRRGVLAPTTWATFPHFPSSIFQIRIKIHIDVDVVFRTVLDSLLGPCWRAFGLCWCLFSPRVVRESSSNHPSFEEIIFTKATISIACFCFSPKMAAQDDPRSPQDDPRLAQAGLRKAQDRPR